MTPEGFDEAGMAEAEFDPTKGEKKSQNHKTTAKLKTSASNKRDSNGHPMKGIETRLPEPQYRTVAGHVSRRANTSAAADPPPPPPAPIRATSSNQRRGRRKETDGGGLGDDSDDSDSGDQKPGQGNDTPGNSSRRRRPLAQNDPEPTSAGAYSRPFGLIQSKPLHFSREEQERLDRRRELRIVSSIWGDIKQLRSQNSEQAAKRKAQFVNYRNFHRGLLSPRRARQIKIYDKQLDIYDKQLDIYLERSLHRAAVEGITDEVDHVIRTTNQFILELEQNIIQRCETANSARRDPTSATRRRIETMDMALRYVVGARRSAVAMETPMNVNDFPWYYMPPQARGPDETAQEVFAKAFISKMIGGAERKGDYLESPLALEEKVLSANASGDQKTRFFILNRERCGITNAYMEWLCEDVNIESIKNCPVRLLDGLRAMQRLKTLREGTRQEFICQDANHGDIPWPRVSLVMFKGDQPLRAQRVKASELTDMGWNHDRLKALFWRCSLDDLGGRRNLFKVDMNGAVLAIHDLYDKWIDWEDTVGRTMNQQSIKSKVQDS